MYGRELIELLNAGNKKLENFLGIGQKFGREEGFGILQEKWVFDTVNGIAFDTGSLDSS